MKVSKFWFAIISICVLFSIVGCNVTTNREDNSIIIFAAASLTDALEDIGQLYTKASGINVTFNFDSSGTLKTQIENGAPVDIFISAATTQMNDLEQDNFIDSQTIVPLLENTVVLIKPTGSELSISSFEDVVNDEVNVIAIGNNSVPVGQYTQSIYTHLGMWDTVQQKATFATNVRQVLDWVATSNADCGIVYATDAAIEEKVEIVSEAPQGSLERVIYPAGIVSESNEKQVAKEFLSFLQTEEVRQIFENYGFSMYKE